MELRSSRSRSKTPFVQLTRIDLQDSVIESNYEVVEEEITNQRSYSTRNRTKKLNNTSTSGESFSLSGKQTTRRSNHKTSDYSSEDGDEKVHSTISDDGSESFKSRVSSEILSRNGEVKSPLQLYKEAGEYWNKYPKTDYTYSMHSKDRIELAPGVVAMPNMSRRSIRRSMEPTTIVQENHSKSYYSETAEHSNMNHRYDYRKNLERKALFRDEVDSDYEYETTVQQVSIVQRFYRRVTSVFTRIIRSILTVIMVVYNSVKASTLWLARGYYKAVSRLFLFDTWLMQKRSAGVSNGSKRYGALIALMVLPLLLFAGWWLFSGLKNIDQETFFTATESSPTINDAKLDEQLSKIILAAKPDEETYNINDIITMLLSNPDFEKIITKHISGKTKIFNEEVNSLKTQVTNLNNKIENVNSNLKLDIAASNAKLGLEINRCCKRQFVYIESYVKKLLADLLGSSNYNLQPEDISKWLNTIFVAKHELETKLNNVTINLHSDMDRLVEATAAKIMNEVTNKINYKLKEQLEFNKPSNIGFDSALSNTEVHRIVREALAIYDADKTGLVDYALESSGGQILSTRCTENYHSRTAVVSVLGIPLWFPSNTPRVVITPGVTPGECWAFQNFPGFLVIELSNYVKISAFSLEHIPKSLTPGGHRDSAPRAFNVWGLKTENDRDPWLLGSYEYDLEGPALQFFSVDNESPAFNMVELRVESNHGNVNYTCLYRFRVHGSLSNEPT